MANEVLKRDENSAVVLGAITDNVAQEIRMLRVDPTTGRLLVTDTISGGTTGISILTATGVVDNSNLDFTFTTEPTFIISDGAWYTALDSNGNTQWTWNGVNTVTMIIPPSTYISGVVITAISGSSIISTGSGAPVSTPLGLGYIYVDTLTSNIYMATGTSSSADWKLISII